ncbi:MAG TPA: M28 family metallopeptidase [Candidatus Limnocylindria bacterium]|nr:M28 family metallopeptidase [Candidatus Limnocylindria bacterium]
MSTTAGERETVRLLVKDLSRVAVGGAVAAAIVIGILAASPSLDLRSARVARALETIAPDGLAAHVRFLADDLLEGRGTGSRGHELAARYVATRFAALGLDSIGTGDAYLQHVPLRHALLAPGGARVTLTRSGVPRRLRFEEDFVMAPDAVRRESRVAGEVVFVGHGVTAPELGYDDFAGIDVRGKIACVLSGAPPTFPNDPRAHYSTTHVKETNLVEHGAIGYLVVRTPVDERRGPWERTVRQSRQGSMKWLDESGTPYGVRPELRVAATLSRRGAERLFTGARRSLGDVFADAEAGRSRPFALPVRAELARISRHGRVSSPNVAALLRGSDPKLGDEVVIYSAHLDHLGITTPVRGDSINNGAIDNASGVACMLEIARAFATAPERPRRSILFLAVTGEERGLLGSEYFAAHPPMPIGNIAANLNLDMFLMLFPMRDVIAFGAEHSTLGTAVAKAAARLAIPVSRDPVPEEVIFVRSDQYSFVRRGVPAVFLVGGRESAEPSLDGEQISKRWMQTTYHMPQDDLSQALDFESCARFARLNYLVGYLVANQEARPQWLPGDFFGEIFAQEPRR